MSRHALWFLLAVGCASPMSSLREDNRRLNETVAELRAERRAQDRKLRDLQHQLDKLRAERVSSLLSAPPSLPVEVAAPPDTTPIAASPDGVPSRVVAVTEDGTEIVYEGDAALGRAASYDDEPAPVARRTVPARASVDPPRRSQVSARPSPVAKRDRGGDASNEYRAAVELVRSGSYEEGAVALRAFLRKHPRHEYADNAQYWLGEAYYARKDYPHALTEFRNVIETYPRGNKVPDALLKVGYCYQALGQNEKARAVLEQVVNLYPKTEPAVLAAKRLETP